MGVSFVNGELFVDGISFNNGTDILNSFVNVSTWTPVLTASTTPPNSVTYSVQAGKYIVLGPFIIFGFAILLSAFTLGGGSGDLVVSGLAISNTGSTTRGGIPTYANLTIPTTGLGLINPTGVAFEVPASTNTIKLICSYNNAATQYVDISGVASNTLIQGAGFYFTS